MLFWVGLTLGCLSGLPSCSSDGEMIQSKSKGALTLALDANVNYPEDVKTKVVNESDYANVENYTVQILQDENIIETYTYSEMPALILLDEGKHGLRAFFGDDKVLASTDVMYVEGLSEFTIEKDKQAEAEVTCRPVSAKVVMDFDESTKKYFKDFSVSFETGKTVTPFILTEEKLTTPVYFKTGEEETLKVKIQMTQVSTSKVLQSTSTYKITPRKALTMHVKTQGNGQVVLSVKIDDTLIERPIDIIVPDPTI